MIRRFSISISLIIMSLLSTLCAFAANPEKIRFEWGGSFDTFFDNREGDGRYTRAETFFLTRLAPEVGLSFDHGRHRIMGGVVWVQPIGCEWDGYQLSPTAYYRYDAPKIKASLGMFPRTQLIEQLPDFLESDSLNYYQLNIRGGLIQYQDERGYFEAFIDWRGMQTETRREAFAIIGQGRWQHGLLMAGGHGMLNHLALARHASDQYVNDNIVLNPYIGVDFIHLLGSASKFRHLDITAGLLCSLSRDRSNWEWVDAYALHSELRADWWRFNLHNTLTVGNRPIFPFYEKFRSLLHEGQPYYASKFYDSLEAGALLVKYKDIVDLNAALDFNFTSDSFMFCQKLTLNVTF